MGNGKWEMGNGSPTDMKQELIVLRLVELPYASI